MAEAKGMKRTGWYALLTGGLLLVAPGLAAEDNAVKLLDEHGEELSYEEKQVVEEALSPDVLQPGEYRIDVDVDTGSARIIEVDPALDPDDSAH